MFSGTETPSKPLYSYARQVLIFSRKGGLSAHHYLQFLVSSVLKVMNGYDRSCYLAPSWPLHAANGYLYSLFSGRYGPKPWVVLLGAYVSKLIVRKSQTYPSDNMLTFEQLMPLICSGKEQGVEVFCLFRSLLLPMDTAVKCLGEVLLSADQVIYYNNEFGKVER